MNLQKRKKKADVRAVKAPQSSFQPSGHGQSAEVHLLLFNGFSKSIGFIEIYSNDRLVSMLLLATPHYYM